MTFAAALRPPVHSWREDVSAFTFQSHPALCSELKPFVLRLLGDFAVVGAGFFFFFPNLPLLTASEKQTLFGRRWYLRAAPEGEPE